MASFYFLLYRTHLLTWLIGFLDHCRGLILPDHVCAPLSFSLSRPSFHFTKLLMDDRRFPWRAHAATCLETLVVLTAAVYCIGALVGFRSGSQSGAANCLPSFCSLSLSVSCGVGDISTCGLRHFYWWATGLSWYGGYDLWSSSLCTNGFIHPASVIFIRLVSFHFFAVL
jgi:hypothetical protein